MAHVNERISSLPVFFFFFPLLFHSISSFLYHFPALHSRLFIFMVPAARSPPVLCTLHPQHPPCLLFPATILCLLRFLPLTCECAARVASRSFIFANGPAFYLCIYFFLCLFVWVEVRGWGEAAFQSHFTLLRVEETRHITLLHGKEEGEK